MMLYPISKYALKKVAKWAVITAVAVSAQGFSALRQGYRRSGNSFIVVIREGSTDLSSSGRSDHSCITVAPDGRFHLERRTQHMPNPIATLEISESSLDSTQFEQLKSILDQAAVRQLPTYKQPPLPMAVPFFYGFNATISRGPDHQEVGYVTWRGGSAKTSPNSAPDNLKQEWRRSEVALRPLSNWLREVRGLKQTTSDGAPTLCAADEESGMR